MGKAGRHSEREVTPDVVTCLSTGQPKERHHSTSHARISLHCLPVIRTKALGKQKKAIELWYTFLCFFPNSHNHPRLASVRESQTRV